MCGGFDIKSENTTTNNLRYCIKKDEGKILIDKSEISKSLTMKIKLECK